MLGLIRGRSAGEAMFGVLALMLPRFLLVRPPLPSNALSFSRLPGVVADSGEATTEGLAKAEVGLVEDGVLSGPNFGVFLADIRGVCSVEVDSCAICVSIRLGAVRGGCGFAASGSCRSSKLPVPSSSPWPSPFTKPESAAFLESNDFGVAADLESCPLTIGDW